MLLLLSAESNGFYEGYVGTMRSFLSSWLSSGLLTQFTSF